MSIAYSNKHGDGAQIWVTFCPMINKKGEVLPRPFYTLDDGTVVNRHDINYNTVAQEIRLVAASRPVTPQSIGEFAFRVWQNNGFSLISKREVDEMKQEKAGKVDTLKDEFEDDFEYDQESDTVFATDSEEELPASKRARR